MVLVVCLFSILSLRFSTVQTYLGRQVASYLSEELNTTIDVKKINIHPLDRLFLEDLLVLDLQGDTVLNTKSLGFKLWDLNIDKNRVEIASISLKEADIQLIKPAGQKGFSFQFIIDYFDSDTPPEDNKKKFIVTGQNISIQNSRVRFKDYRSTPNTYGMNYADLDFYDLNLNLNNFKSEGSYITGNIENLSVKEKCGFEVKKIAGNLALDSNFATIDSLLLITGNSNLSADYLTFKFDSFEDFEDDFERKVIMQTNLRSSILNFKDIAYFTSFFEGLNREVTVQGKFDGTVSNFITTDLFIQIDQNTSFYGDLNMTGLPYADSTIFYANIVELKTNEQELEQIQIPPFTSKEKIKLPSEASGIGTILVKGTVEGNFSDVKGNLAVSTAIGEVNTKSHFWLNNKTKTSFFEGSLTTDNLEIQKLFPDSKISTIDGDVYSKVIWNKRNGVDANVKGEIKSMTFNNYTYKDIFVDGDINSDFFKGNAVIKDENANLVFDGLINYKDSIPLFDFKAKIFNLNLQELNFSDDSTTRIICADVNINGDGNSLDNANGFAIINNLNYYQNGIEYKADEIEFVASPKENGKIVNLTSTLVDATIDGLFTFEELPLIFNYLGSKVVPALYEKQDTLILKNQQFSFNALIKNFTPIQNLFVPDLYLSKNTFITGDFDSETTNFNTFFKSDTLQFQDKQFVDLSGYIKKPNEQVDIDIDIKEATLNEALTLENIHLKTLVEDNLIEPSISWDVKGSDNYGFIQGNGYWYSLDYFDFLILPSYFSYNNSIWKTNENASLIFDKNQLIFDSLTIENEAEERIIINDTVSEASNKQVELFVNNFNLGNLNDLLGLTDVRYNGKVNGFAKIGSILSAPTIEASITIDSLKANEELLGDLSFNSVWKRDNKGIICDGNLSKNKIKAFDFSGVYYPFVKENALNFKATMNKTPIAFVGDYLKDQGLSNLKGSISGEITVKGEPETPILEGRTLLDKVNFRIDYLNTSYDFTGELLIGDGEIVTKDNIEIIDEQGNLATFNGAVYHENFKDFDFNIAMLLPAQAWTYKNTKKAVRFENSTLKPNNFLCMNTNSALNSDFYGKVYASGFINISGYQDELKIEVEAKTSKGTVFTLPLYGSSTIALEDYIQFKVQDSSSLDSNKVDLTGIDLDLKIEATPDAQLQIIFDEVYGDAMRARGSGNLEISVDQNNDIQMKGKYIIDEGDYLFTLGLLNFENIFNKKFQVASGSSISWYGDPLNAEIDIDAIYKLKASLYDITGIYTAEERSKYKNRTEVECYMYLSENLLKPSISFGIELPRADENGKTALRNVIQTEQDLNKQVFSLLILNRFLPPANSVSDDGRSSSGAVSSTASELLSNQVSNWLSQLSNGFDLGFNYRPGDNISNDEVALALSTEILNDRLVISTNFGVSTGNNINQNPNNLIGDVSVEYKLNKDGTFRVRAFTRTNEYDITNTSQGNTTQGAGLYYKKEFNNLKDFKWIGGK